MNDLPRVVIGIPSRDLVHADFAMCLVNLCVRSAQSGFQFAVVNTKGSHIDKSRNNIVKHARTVKFMQGEQATHVLFIDSDQTFPASALIDLYYHAQRFSEEFAIDPEKVVFGATSVTRQEPVRLVAKDHTDQPLSYASLFKEHVLVRSNGFAMQLVPMKVFDTLPFPWFRSGYGPGEVFHSEDEGFCKLCWDNYITMVVDTAVSMHVGHIGSKVYTPKDIK